MNDKVSLFSHNVTQKVSAVETNLQQSFKSFKELVAELERIHIETESYKTQYLALKQKCENDQCDNTVILKKEIESKDSIIDKVASALTQLLETKDLNIVDDILRIICNTTSVATSPKKEFDDKNVSNQDESISEIEGTPTGRTSPIIKSRKIRNTTNGLSLNKKKCPETWETPEKKSMKLLYPSPSRPKPGGRLKQSRLNLVKVKSTSVVDLTCSPETLARAISSAEAEVKCNIKKEILNEDETILPSPTSAFPISQVFLPRSTPKNSPMKFKKPSTPLKFKIEQETMIEDNVIMKISSPTYTQQMDAKCVKKNLKLSPKQDENMDCDADNSMSLLQQKRSPRSPQKGMLLENNNVINVKEEIESSMSILQRNVKVNKISPSAHTADRRKPDDAGPIYKEATVRKKSEKRALRGWSCSECRDFYGELYKDNPQMLELKMDECSKHRGKNNPIRAKTPPGFWNPRWDVPEDTEEFNRRNNV